MIETFGKLDSGFEIASLREMKKIPLNSFIVYNGPAKTVEELEYAVKNDYLNKCLIKLFKKIAAHYQIGSHTYN